MNLGILLSHHPPEEQDRCLHLGGVAVCRRCTALWPLAYGLLAAQVVLRAPPEHPADEALPVLLAVPVTEFVLVQLGFTPYAARRVWWMSAVLAVALGRLFYRYLRAPLDPFTLSLLAGAGLISGWAAWRHLQDPPSSGPGSPRSGDPGSTGDPGAP